MPSHQPCESPEVIRPLSAGFERLEVELMSRKRLLTALDQLAHSLFVRQACPYCGDRGRQVEHEVGADGQSLKCGNCGQWFSAKQQGEK
jgi:predicted Zn finger-like uncharacterized protein